MKIIHPNLILKRQQWEKHQRILLEIYNYDCREEKVDIYTLLSIVKNDEGNYSLYRYFSLENGTRWEASVDVYEKSSDEVFTQLNKLFNRK